MGAQTRHGHKPKKVLSIACTWTVYYLIHHAEGVFVASLGSTSDHMSTIVHVFAHTSSRS